MKSYDNSVWWENVDEALINQLREFEYPVYTKKGEVMNKVPVHYFPLNSDTTKYEYPMIAIRHATETFDNDRYDPNPIQVAVREDGFAVFEDPAIPYTLGYQLDIIASKQRDMNYLVKQFISTFKPRGHIEVKDASGNKRSCYYTQYLQSHSVNYQSVRGEDRLLRTIVLFNVSVEVDSGKQREVKIVTKSPIINNSSE